MSYNPDHWFIEVGGHTRIIVAMLMIAYTATYTHLFRQLITVWRNRRG